ncbi:adenosine deaminase [Amycolatopsis sp., V23-08]|uniref:Adenosine deaminase n=1 Tax=Amycolatopsis heterodermiae TaxID=3110235 RepID=A0ABU5RBQ2_9PSEU|nr:adenosine deaminase [Amycolatopsis sp., V23-08]MEA5363682.1 adenosine deaminase [Amycolatopsis sp., V23-08]
MPEILTGPALRAFARAPPKVELHVHLVGSASLPTVLEPARRRPEAGAPTGERELAAFFTFRDFDHFLTVYFAGTSLVAGLATDLAAQNCRYAEVPATPYNRLLGRHARRRPARRARVGPGRAAERGVERAWCFDIPGEKGTQAGAETLVFALRERPEGLVSFGLGGPELGVGRAPFASFFTRAREAGPHSALHDLGAERIGHGTSCAADPALLEHLAVQRIPLEVCPTSNVRTGQVRSVAEHPVQHRRPADVRRDAHRRVRRRGRGTGRPSSVTHGKPS